MADEPRKGIAAAELLSGDTSASLTAAEHVQLRARTATARAGAKAAAARCLELRMKFEISVSEQAQWREALIRVLPELRDSVGRYARCLRDEGAPPEQMLVLVKEALHEALPSTASGASSLLEMSVGCAIEAYYGLTAA